MRVGAVRVWLRGAVNTSVGRARSIGHAITRRIKSAADKISVSVGVGDDESSFGGGRSQMWLEVVDEYRKKLLAFLERSTFERFPRFEKFMRRILGGDRPLPPALPSPEKPKVPVKLGAHTPPTNEEAAKFRAQIQLGIMKAHTEEHAGLRENVSRHRADGMVGRADPDEERRGRRSEPEPEPEEDDTA